MFFLRVLHREEATASRHFQLSTAEGAADPASPLGHAAGGIRANPSQYFLGEKYPCVSRIEGIGVPASNVTSGLKCCVLLGL